MEKQSGNFAKSETHFKQALKVDPGFFQARYNLANLYDTQHEYPKAKRLYLEVIKQQPKFVEALANLSSILETEHQLDDAELFANRALDIDPDHYVARLTLVNIATRNKSFDEVIGLLLPLMQSPCYIYSNFSRAQKSLPLCVIQETVCLVVSSKDSV